MEVVKLSCVPGRNQRKKPFLSRGHWFTAQLLEGLLSSVGCTVYLGYTLNRPSNNLRDFIGYGDSSTVHNLGAITMTNNKFVVMDSSYINHPIIGVTLYGATAFAEYYSMRLPSVLEWEKSARGMDGYVYPWGDQNNANLSNFYGSGDPWESGTTPVGYYNSKSPYAVHYTRGGPWFDEWQDVEFAREWINERDEYLSKKFTT